MAREGGVMAWQWSGYGRNHRDRANLLLHFVAVPAFIAGTLGLATALVRGWLLGAVASLVVMVVAFAVQGLGHKREPEPPIPFDGPGDFLARVFVEQFITFPRFVLSGGWMRQLQSGD
jgi:uncharacterized membrane protein YGL010W